MVSNIRNILDSAIALGIIALLVAVLPAVSGVLMWGLLVPVGFWQTLAAVIMVGVTMVTVFIVGVVVLGMMS